MRCGIPARASPSHRPRYWRVDDLHGPGAATAAVSQRSAAWHGDGDDGDADGWERRCDDYPQRRVCFRPDAAAGAVGRGGCNVRRLPDDGRRVVGAPRGNLHVIMRYMYQLAGIDFSGSDNAADRALYVATCTAAGLRTVGLGINSFNYGDPGVESRDDVNCRSGHHRRRLMPRG